MAGDQGGERPRVVAGAFSSFCSTAVKTSGEDHYQERQRPSRTSAAFTKYRQEAGSLFESGLLTLVAGVGFERTTSGVMSQEGTVQSPLVPSETEREHVPLT